MSYIKVFTYEEKAANTKRANAVCRKYGLTAPQMGVLREAARPWKYPVGSRENREVYDGQVHSYGVRIETLKALAESGFTQVEYLYPEEKRVALRAEADELIRGAHQIFCQDDPFRRVEDQDGVIAWQAVLVDLRLAKAKMEERKVKVTRITVKGREAVAEFLEALGIVED